MRTYVYLNGMGLVFRRSNFCEFKNQSVRRHHQPHPYRRNHQLIVDTSRQLRARKWLDELRLGLRRSGVVAIWHPPVLHFHFWIIRPSIVGCVTLRDTPVVCRNTCRCNTTEIETNRRIFHGIHCADHKQVNDAIGTVARSGNHPDSTFACARAYIFPSERIARTDRDLAMPVLPLWCCWPKMEPPLLLSLDTHSWWSRKK